METAGSVYPIEIRISHDQLVCISHVPPGGVEVWGEKPLGLQPSVLCISHLYLAPLEAEGEIP